MDKANRNRTTLKRILRYISRYKILVFLSVFFSAVGVGMTLYVPILTGQAIDQIIGPEQVNFPVLMKILEKILIVTAVIAVAQWLKNHINNKVTYHVVEDIRTRAFNHIQKLPVSYVDHHPSGDIVSRIITDTDQF